MSYPRRPGLRAERERGGIGGAIGYLIRAAFGFALIGAFFYYVYMPLFLQEKPPQNQAAQPQVAAAQPVQPPVVSVTPSAVPPVSPAPAVPSGTSTTVELATTTSIQRQQLTVAKFNQRQAVGLFDEATKALDEWEKEQTAWEKEGPPLLTGEAGKQIAADPAQVKRFRGLVQQDRPTAGELATARQLAEELVTPIRESLVNAEDASSPSDAITTNLKDLQTKARKARDGYRQARNAVKAILAQVKDKAPAGRTLEKAIAALDQEDAAVRFADIDAAEKKAKDEGAKKVAEEKARLAKEVSDAQALRLADEAARTKQNAEMEAAKRKQEAEFAAAKTAEEMKVAQKKADQQIARLQEEAEKRRQGDLKTGSIWKGAVRDGSFDCEGTLTVDDRLGDDIKCSLVYESPGGGLKGRVNFKGKVNGTSIRLTPTAHAPESDVHSAVFNPAARTLSGQGTSRSFNLRLSGE